MFDYREVKCLEGVPNFVGTVTRTPLMGAPISGVLITIERPPNFLPGLHPAGTHGISGDGGSRSGMVGD